MRIDTGDTAYSPNSLDDHFPATVPVEEGGFATYPERVDGQMRRVRSASFNDYFSQATMFYNSMSPLEREHIATAFSFVQTPLRQIMACRLRSPRPIAPPALKTYSIR